MKTAGTVLALRLVLGLIAFLRPCLAQRSIEPGNRQRNASLRADGTLDLALLWSQGRAEGREPVRLTHSPMRLVDIEQIAPYGLMIGGHVCPIHHGYFYARTPLVSCNKAR
jgi:hypothetical protein